MDLIQGGIDTHVHTAPSVIKRKLDDLEMARQAGNAGMRGIVLKSHEGCSTARAYLAQKVTGLSVYGGLCLNSAVGGLNPEAVETSLKMGAKIVWLPTLSSHRHASFFSSPAGKKLGFSLKGSGEGLRIVGDDGKLNEPVYHILELVRRYDAVIATGHIGTDEVCTLAKAAVDELRIEKIIYNHPDINFLQAPLAMQQELAAKGVFIEKCCVSMYPPWSVYTAQEAAAMIKEIGAGQCLLSSDLGQVENPLPVEGMKAFLHELHGNGLSEAEIRTMWADNPLALFG